MSWPAAFIFALIILFRAGILGVTAYAVFWLGHSGWWFLLAILLTSVSPEIEVKGDGKGSP